MHVTTKEVDQQGVHILTSVIEGDGALPLLSEAATIDATVIAVARTASGGIQVQTAVTVTEPTPASALPAPSADDKAVSYLVSRGQTHDDAVANVGKFGAARILAAQAKEQASADEKLDAELAALL